MMSAPPTAGQNPETVNPLTRNAVKPSNKAFKTTRKRPSVNTIYGKASRKRIGRRITFKNVRISTAAMPAVRLSASRPGTIEIARKTAIPVMRIRMSA